jgi:hypothetical protein
LTHVESVVCLTRKKLCNFAPYIAHNYGDRAGKSRLTTNCNLRAARPPQGNAIVTAEFPPDIDKGTGEIVK